MQNSNFNFKSITTLPVKFKKLLNKLSVININGAAPVNQTPTWLLFAL